MKFITAILASALVLGFETRARALDQRQETLDIGLPRSETDTTLGTPFRAAVLADLPAASTRGLRPGAIIGLGGRTAVGDGGGGLYVWAPSSRAAEDGCTTIRPADIAPTAAGRWLRVDAAPLNVRCFGAKLDGRSDDSAAFSAARSAAPDGVIDVPAGLINLTMGVSGGPSTSVLWRMNGNKYPDKKTPVYGVGTDIVETLLPFNGKYLSRSQTDRETGAVLTVRQDITHSTVGTGVIPTLNTETYITSNPKGQFVWNNLHKMYDKSRLPGGNNVTTYSQYNREEGGTPGWGLVVEHRDKSGKPSSATAASVAAEFDLFGENHDDSDRRIGIDMVVGRHYPAKGRFMEAATAFRTSSVLQNGMHELEQSWFKRGFSVESGISVAAFDASRAKYLDKNKIALRIGAENTIDLSNDGARLLVWNVDGLQYLVDGLPVFKIDDKGNVHMRGTIKSGGLPDQRVPAPSASKSPCRTGEHAWDSKFEYRCVDTNTWKRTELIDW
ncbi:hypothetical protein [Methylobacterium aquaticum]|uniref:hypothetical protein n=1 Tax=Methylobacterium aquaticum TaxID=270351 RepID=UPI0019332813|nr:hypothetical protein [Methylobacterium aquaticum]QRE72676.1 hypothetical protein F1D61_02330 [Methylobacterium aquaticum]